MKCKDGRNLVERKKTPKVKDVESAINAVSVHPFTNTV
jgi:hypothetical protein